MLDCHFWALNMTWYWPYAVRSWILAWNVLQAFLGLSAIGPFRKIMKDILFSYGNAWALLTFSKACARWGHVFATDASPRSWTKNWLHNLPMFMAVSMILNMWHSSSYCMQHPWRTLCGAISLNQLVLIFLKGLLRCNITNMSTVEILLACVCFAFRIQYVGIFRRLTTILHFNFVFCSLSS